MGGFEPQARWQASAFLAAGSSSFTDFLAMAAPGLLPQPESSGGGGTAADLPHGTTIVSALCADGVVMAGDRRATAGNLIAQRNIREGVPH